MSIGSMAAHPELMTNRPNLQKPSTSPRVQPASRSADLLGRALHFLRMTGVVYCHSELSGPWGLALPPMKDCLMFHAVTEGQCWLGVPGGEPVLLKAGDFALVPRGEGHHLLAEKGARAIPFFDLPREHIGDRFEVLRHGQGGPSASLVCGAVRFDDPLAIQLVGALPRQIVFQSQKLADQDWLGAVLQLLASEMRQLRPGGEAVITRLADILVLQSIRTWLDLDPGARTGWLGALQDPQLGQALVLIHEEPQKAWTIDSLAREVAMSRSAFAARFSASVGMPVLQYLTHWRMSLAQTRLETETVRLAELAESLGYESEASFSRAFKRWSRMSPGGVARLS